MPDTSLPLIHLSDAEKLAKAAVELREAADRLERAGGALHRDQARIVGNAEFCISQAQHLLADWRCT